MKFSWCVFFCWKLVQILFNLGNPFGKLKRDRTGWSLYINVKSVIMKLNQQSLGVVWVLSALQLVSSVSGNSEHVYKICENISASNITTHAILINNDFPNASQSRNCSCTLMSHKSPMKVLPAYLTMSGNSATTSNTSTTLKMSSKM